MCVKRRSLRLVLVAGVVAALAACAETRYAAFNRGPGDDPVVPTARVVNYELSESFFRSPPSCVLVLPLTRPDDVEAALLVEESATRFLRERFDRVIGPHQRRADERRLALLTRTEEGRLAYLSAQNCDSYLQVQLEQIDAVYALFWSGRQIGLSATLLRARDDRLMWRASHTARRSDGSLPLSLLSLPFATYESTRFHLDRDIVPSMIDDVVRRMFSTLPAI